MANRNDAVVEILKLAYEFENSVARPDATVGPTPAWFLEALYEPTKLDTELLPEVLADRFDLVLVTGNPGDGKSAFLAKVVRAETTMSGRRILVKHDATEPADPSDRAASALADLVSFLGKISDETWSPEDARRSVFVLGINKGLLVRAFLAPRSPLSRIGISVAESLASGSPVEVEGFRLVVVDLNKRAEANLPLEGRDSLFDRILGRMVGSSLWEDRGCRGCDDAGWCPFFANARRLRNDQARERLKLLWLVQQFRSERHATIRDFLATLAYLLIGHEDMFHQGDEPAAPILHPCHFVEREAATGDTLALFRRMLYNSAFVDEDVYEGRAKTIEPGLAPSTARTYGMAPFVVRLHLNDLDPATGLSNEAWDELEDRILKAPHRALDRAKEEAERDGSSLERAFLQRIDDSLSAVSSSLDEVEPSATEYAHLRDDYQWLIYLLIRTLKRRTFFASDGDVGNVTRYASLGLFIEALRYVAEGLPSAVDAYEEATMTLVPRGLMRSEGVTLLEERARRVEIRWSSSRKDVGALLVLPLTAPALVAEPAAVPYVEVFPDRLTFVPFSGSPDRRLVMSLETFEGLFRLAAGYHEGFQGVPRTSQLRNFRESLRGLEADEMVILDFDDPSSRVSVTLRERMRFD